MVVHKNIYIFQIYTIIILYLLITIHKGGEEGMIEVKVMDPHNFEKAMRIFKKACQKDGFMMELKERRFYSKPSEKKRFKGKKR